VHFGESLEGLEGPGKQKGRDKTIGEEKGQEGRTEEHEWKEASMG
jgi:hypothetical protein